MRAAFPKKYMPVIPGYSDLFGRKPKLNDLIDIIRQFPLIEWQSFLSRIQSIVCAKRFPDLRNQLSVLKGVFSRELQSRISGLAAREGLSRDIFVCHERQLGTLQELAFLHAPHESDGTFESEDGRHKLGIALLMTIDLIVPNVQEAEEDVIASVIQQQIRMAQTPYWIFFSRALKFYELESKERSEIVRQYLSLFERAVGVDPFDFILGGLVVAVPEIVRSKNEQAEGWQPVLPSEQRANAVERRLVQAYEKVRCGTIENVRKAVLQYENRLSIGDWNLISLYRYPLVKFPDKGTFILNLSALGRSLFDGVRHTIQTAALEKQLDTKFCDLQRLGGLYGELFQRYILSVLEARFPGRVIQIPESRFPGKADCLISFPGKVVVIEIKSGHFIVANHYRFMNIVERKTEIEKVGLSKATQQIESTIRSLKKYALKLPTLPYYDWTITPIVPLIITEERFPTFPLCWKKIYEQIERPLKLLQDVSGLVGPLRILSLDEVEIIPTLSGKHDFGSLLLQWGRSPELHEYPFRNYLQSCGHSWSDDFMRTRWAAARRLLATTLGFDSNRF